MVMYSAGPLLSVGYTKDNSYTSMVEGVQLSLMQGESSTQSIQQH
jgi:hypothetical protein